MQVMMDYIEREGLNELPRSPITDYLLGRMDTVRNPLSSKPFPVIEGTPFPSRTFHTRLPTSKEVAKARAEGWDGVALVREWRETRQLDEVERLIAESVRHFETERVKHISESQ